jgi:hypothetical protein
MSSIANDYEDFEMISNETKKWAEEDGLEFERAEILEELAELIRNDYAKAYLISPDPPHVVVAAYSEACADSLWFMLTTAGKRTMKELESGTRGSALRNRISTITPSLFVNSSSTLPASSYPTTLIGFPIVSEIAFWSSSGNPSNRPGGAFMSTTKLPGFGFVGCESMIEGGHYI